MKKVLSIVALCLIGILAGTIIVLSCVNKDFNLNLQNPDFVEVWINSSTDRKTFEKDDSYAENKEIYNEIMNLYNESFKQKLMSSLFNGTIGEKAVIKNWGYNKSTTSVTNSGTWLVFGYNDTQTLKVNGKDYTDNTSNSKNYKKLYIQVKNSDNMTTFDIYVQKDGTTNSYYYYTARAKQANLYKYLNEKI